MYIVKSGFYYYQGTTFTGCRELCRQQKSAYRFDNYTNAKAISDEIGGHIVFI